MRFLLRILPPEEERDGFLLMVRRIGSIVGVRVVNPKWTSYGALEVDVFAETKADFESLVAALEPLGETEFAKDLQEGQPFMPKSQAIREAISLFDGERFWEAHEVLESLWRVAEGDEKILLQGLILVCAALVHQQKGETSVSTGIVDRALPKLVWGERSYHGIDVEGLRKRMARMLAEKKISVFRL